MAGKNKISIVLEVDDKGTAVMKSFGREADKGFDKLKKHAKAGGASAGKMERAWRNSINHMKRHWLACSAAVTAALVAVVTGLTNIIGKFASFEKEFANVSTLVDTSIVSMEKLKKGIMDLHPSLGSATELTKGLYQAISAGVKPARAIEFIGEAAKAAKAGLSDTFTAVDAGTTILNAFGMESSRATKVYDIMFTTVREGKTTFSELASSVGKISPIASAAGVSVTEMHAALATLTKGGFATTESSSRLAVALGSIVKPSSEAEKMSEKLGLQFDAQSLAAQGLHGFLQKVKEATGGNIEKMAQLFGGMESLSVILALTGEQSEEFTDILGRMKKASGATEEAFDKQMTTLVALRNTFKNFIGKQLILIGAELAPVIKGVLEDTNEWVLANKELIKSGIIEWTRDVKEILETLYLAVKKVAEWYERLAKAMEWVRRLSNMPALRKVKEETDDVTSSIRKTITASREAEIGIYDLWDAALAGAEAVTKKTEEATSAIKDWGDIGHWLAGGIAQGATAAKDALKDIKESLTAVQEYWRHTMENIHDATADTFYDIFKDIGHGWSSLIENIKNWFLRLLSQMAAQAIARPIIIPIMTAMGGAMGMPGTAQAGGMGFGMPPGGGGLFSGLQGWLDTPITGWGDTGNLLAGGTGNAGGLAQWGTTWGNIAAYAGIAFNAIQSVKALTKGDWATGILGAGGAIAGGAFFGPIGAAIGGWLGNTIGGLFGMGKSNAGFGSFSHTVVGKGAYGDLPSLGSFFTAGGASGPAPTEMLEGFETAIQDTVQAVYDVIDDFSQQMPESVKKAFLDSLAELEITYLPELEGLISSQSGAFHAAITREQAANLEKYIEMIPEFMLKQIAPSLEEAVLGWMGEINTSKLAADSQIMELYEKIMSGFEEGFEGDITAFADTAAAFSQIINQLDTAWNDYKNQVGLIFEPLTSTEQALQDVNIYFENLIATLEELGYTTEAITEVTEDWATVIKHTLEVQMESMATDIADQIRKMTMSDAEYQLWKIEQEYAARMTQIQEWVQAGVEGLNFEELIAMAGELRDLQIEAMKTQMESARIQEETARAQAEATQRQKDAVQSQLDAAREMERSIAAWKQSFKSLSDQIFGMQTTTTSPQNALERLSIIKGQIDAMTGGVSTAQYIASLAGGDAKVEAIGVIRGLWDQYLSLGGEAYQRPSTEYQQIYGETLTELTALQHYMKDFSIEEYDVNIEQLDVLKDIRAEIARLATKLGAASAKWPSSSPPDPYEGMVPWLGTDIYADYAKGFNDMIFFPIGETISFLESTLTKLSAQTMLLSGPTGDHVLHVYSNLMSLYKSIPDLAKWWDMHYGEPWAAYQHGTDYVPKTGPAILHKGEKVIPAGVDYPEMKTQLNLNVTVNESKTPQATGKAVVKEMEGFLRSAIGRKLVQQISKGR